MTSAPGQIFMINFYSFVSHHIFAARKVHFFLESFFVIVPQDKLAEGELLESTS